jgi:hypothetical protein
MDSFKGSYKLSAKMLYKMISSSATYKGQYAGASRYEILALIHLSHIADASGYVEKFRTREFMSATGCSRREAFQLIHSLQYKGYITLSDSDWKCCYDIRICDNDFSSEKKGVRYLNTNHEFFEMGLLSHEDFRGLSHTAMRLLLFLLFNYSMGYGYHASYRSIKQALGIVKTGTLNRALSELEPLLSYKDCYYKIREDLKRGFRYGYLDLAPRNGFFQFTEGIDRGQDTFFKRHIRLFTAGEGISIDSLSDSVDSLFKRLYGIMQSFTHKNASVSDIYEVLHERIRIDGILNELTALHVSSDLSAIYA